MEGSKQEISVNFLHNLDNYLKEEGGGGGWGLEEEEGYEGSRGRREDRGGERVGRE